MSRGRQLLVPSISDIAPPPGMLAWLKADADTYQDVAMTTRATADGDRVRALRDQSGKGYHCFQPYSVDRAPLLKLNVLNGLPALRFDGVDDVLERYSQADFPLIRPLTLGFIISAAEVSSAYHYVFGWGENGGDGSAAVDVYPTTSQLRYVRGGLGSVMSSTVLTANTYFFQVVTDNGTTIRHRRNGAADGLGNLIFTPGVVGYVLGNTVGYWNNWFQGDIVEVLMYNRLLSDSGIAKLERYLSYRSGIALP